MMNNFEDSMSNLTSSVSNEASVSSTNRNDNLTPTLPPSLPLKKKRNQPGHPDPDAEVIALSPKTLLATNRFVCEICNKGFQRDQNLQLHRRGHNLPWKLKQKSNKDAAVRKKVYVCPEARCVHHDPSRALGDLTGIKKHFSRKHGEKKWKCNKCSKKYAVQSDWKAHSKVCGTKEYRCGCGTLFSRRDSFITHRAFCDALGQETAGKISIPNPQSAPCNNSTSHQTDLPQIQIHSQFNNFSRFPIKKEHQNFSLRSEIPTWLSPPPTIDTFPSGPPAPAVDYTAPPPPSSLPSIFQDFQQNQNPNPTRGSTGPTVLPPVSATALLQKACSMSPAGGFISAHVPAYHPSRDDPLAAYGNRTGPVTGGGGGGFMVAGAPAGEITNQPSCSSSSSFVFHGFDGTEFEESLRFQVAIDQLSSRSSSDGMTTRDFLGLREGDIFSLSSYMNNQIDHAEKSWQG